MATQGEDGMLAAKPDALDVDRLGQIPDVLRGGDGIFIFRVHDTGIVEYDIQTTPAIKRIHGSLDLDLLGDIAELRA